MSNSRRSTPAYDTPIKDSGTRQEFSTGAVRDGETGKGRPCLISPLFTNQLSKHCEKGAEKYGDRNYEKGMPMSRTFDSCQRHMLAFQEGKTDEDHLAAAAFNIMALVHYQEMIGRGLLPAELDDMPNYTPEELPAKKEPMSKDNVAFGWPKCETDAIPLKKEPWADLPQASSCEQVQCKHCEWKGRRLELNLQRCPHCLGCVVPVEAGDNNE